MASRGFRISVFNYTNYYQIFTENGIDVPVGKKTSIMIKRSFANHLPSPYGNCLDPNVANVNWNANDVLKFMYNNIVANETFNLTYTQYLCLKMCFQKYLFQTCGCFDKTVPKHPNLTDYYVYHVCYHELELKCQVNVSDNFFTDPNLSGSCYDLCPIECTENSFELISSYSQYPTYWYANMLNKNAFFNKLIVYLFDEANEKNSITVIIFQVL